MHPRNQSQYDPRVFRRLARNFVRYLRRRNIGRLVIRPTSTVRLENPERSEPTRIILLSEFSPTMLTSLLALLITLRSILGSRLDLQLEILALRHQIAVLQRSAKKRPRLTATDRLLWVSLSASGAVGARCWCSSSRKRLW